MDPLEELIKEVHNNPIVKKCTFANNFLNSAANIFQRDGYGGLELFLQERKSRDSLKEQVEALFVVSKMMRKYPIVKQKRGYGRLLIKSLISTNK